MNLKKMLFKKEVELKNYTTIKIGGKAKNFFVVETVDEIYEILNTFGTYYILGKGSNLLVKDTVIEKPVIKLAKTFDYIKKDGDFFEVGAATQLSSLLRFFIENDIGGLENLAGIPATVGGLIVMNASAFGKEVSRYLEAVEVIDKDGILKKIQKKDIFFGYRQSSLEDTIVLRAWFNFLNIKDIKERIKDFLKVRYQKQDFEFPSCGCIFKNPPKESAAFMIECCGLKGLCRNDAQISTKHANFIINLGNAKYSDVDYLIQLIKEKVYSRFGVILEEEIKRWG